jgi:hypothetical protein
MKPDKAEKPADISKVIDLALAYNPMMATADLSTARMWVNEGCSIELDILPTMKKIMEWKKGVSAFRYFTNPILEARDKRLIGEKQAKEAIKAPESHYISIYKWKRSKGLPLTTEEERKLDEWIQKSPNHLD